MKLPLPDVPSIFFKSRGTVQHPGKDVSVPRIAQNDEMDYEVELAILIGKDCKNASEEEALSYVVGYTCANDLTARKVQDTSSQWTFAKSKSCLLVQANLVGSAGEMSIADGRFRQFLPGRTSLGLAPSPPRPFRGETTNPPQR
jgi:2-keto-4-pentenoate hydratase/2-oxohepta-3-ene-1,7-dioic acid hydratase in catechol pathway